MSGSLTSTLSSVGVVLATSFEKSYNDIMDDIADWKEAIEVTLAMPHKQEDRLTLGRCCSSR